MRFLNVVAVVLAVVAAPSVSAQSAATDFMLGEPVEPFASPLAESVQSIGAGALVQHIEFLASAPLEGRGVGGAGLTKAAEFAAAKLEAAGIAPFGAFSADARTWYQHVPAREVSATVARVVVERLVGESTVTRMFTSGVDCVIAPLAPRKITGPIVFAGYGIREPGRDDYRGIEVRERVVVVLAGVPKGPEWQTPEMLRKYASTDDDERYEAKLEIAQRLGASAVLAVEDETFAGSIAAKQLAEERGFSSYDLRADPPPLIRISRAAAYAIMGEEAVDGALAGSRRRFATSARATIRIDANERLVMTRNVIGILEGSDLKLRQDALVIGAHLDHLGRKGARIYPGADDNASGVAALLEMARAFTGAKEKPKRTIIFVLWSGEEEGKLGSSFYVRHPSWPLQRTVAYLNVDMIGHPWLAEEVRKLVYDNKLPGAENYLAQVKPEKFVEAGLPRNAPALEKALRRSAKGNGLAMHLDWTDGKLGGSDYREFARVNVPFVRFFGNFFPGYHTENDTPEALDAAQVERVARFAFATAWQIANPDW